MPASTFGSPDDSWMIISTRSSMVKRGFFARIEADGHNHPVKDRRRSLDDVQVPVCNRIKTARIDCYRHIKILSAVFLALSVTNEWLLLSTKSCSY